MLASTASPREQRVAARPRARIAVYKSAWGTGGGALNIATVLAAIDDAIHDGVDVLSLSLTADDNSFGALHAVQKGITVVYAAGNNGPIPQTVANTAPWVITVAASKVDRSFPTMITLGNNQSIVGQSFYYLRKNSAQSTYKNLQYGAGCTPDALNGTDLKGKIVLCMSPFPPFPLQTEGPFAYFNSAYLKVLEGGGFGLIFAQYMTDTQELTATCEGIPCVLIDYNTFNQIITYISAGAASSAVAKIEPARSVTGKGIIAPKVAVFSSRGPSTQYDDIIKPDIAAPGANILAALGNSYQIMSGTSMAAPHVSGIIALLKVLHPNWSPAALKSAIVTTASVTNEHGMPILAEGLPRKIADPFDYGGGNIDPNKAADPGLIYDAIRETITTSFAALSRGLPRELRHPITISRTVTNVGEVDAIYHASIQSPLGVKIDVEPSVLVFNAARKVIKFEVKLSPMWKLQGDYTFGSLTWQNGQKIVRIPIAARMTTYDFYADVA
ncbi:hypothetical protein PR202_gb04525 [Eleusine coracana subsp. coracana]|uniref:Uncharacterized protein n=1 Tax=Eleusine coracana subsp. coracana TaxID=191504 RepID=A0AAV5E4R8_ELECO|nr:hypothetical protein PR202_gb04525 [Eleusine coracana subsp. coracana]